MKNIRLLFLFVILTSFGTTVNAQENPVVKEEKLSLDKGTLDSQFEFLMEESTNYQDMKVIKTDWLNKLRSHVQDSLNNLQKKLQGSQDLITNQDTEISQLKADLTQTQNSLQQTRNEKDNMYVFGLELSKDTYSAIMWIIIFALLVLLSIFVYKYKNSHVYTKQAEQSLAEVQDEYENYRRTALEREQKVRRQLVDEINKNKH